MKKTILILGMVAVLGTISCNKNSHGDGGATISSETPQARFQRIFPDMANGNTRTLGNAINAISPGNFNFSAKVSETGMVIFVLSHPFSGRHDSLQLVITDVRRQHNRSPIMTRPGTTILPY